MPGYETRLSDPEVGRIPSVTLGHDRISWRSFRPNPVQRGDAVVSFPERSRVELLRK